MKLNPQNPCFSAVLAGAYPVCQALGNINGWPEDRIWEPLESGDHDSWWSPGLSPRYCVTRVGPLHSISGSRARNRSIAPR